MYRPFWRGGTPIFKILFYIKNIPWNFFIESFFVGPNGKRENIIIAAYFNNIYEK